MRKGYSLLELLMVLALTSVLTVILAEPVRMLLSETPRVSRLPYVQGTVQAMLLRLQGDVDAAEGLLGSYGGYEADEKTLLLRLPEGVVLYRAEAEGVIRKLLGDDGEGVSAGEGPGQEVMVGEKVGKPKDSNAAGATVEDWALQWLTEEVGEGDRWWSIPHGSIRWRLRENEEGPCAVEVHTGLFRGRERTGQAKLENVRIFYVHALSGEVKR